MKEQFLKICTDNTVKVVELENHIHAFYKELRCRHIEIVWPRYLERPCVVICDEEFMLKDGIPLNRAASYMYGTHEHGYPILGDVLIARQNGPETTGLTQDEIKEICSCIGNILQKGK